MKLSEFKEVLEKADQVQFELPNGALVPGHFHITEVGKVTKHFIDCGGTVRHEEMANFQLWSAKDFDHRLKPKKLKNIIRLSEQILDLDDLEIEVEYQGETVGKYGLDYDGWNFLLTSKKTDCLAKDKCGIPEEQLQESKPASCCTPDSGCC